MDSVSQPFTVGNVIVFTIHCVVTTVQNRLVLVIDWAPAKRNAQRPHSGPVVEVWRVGGEHLVGRARIPPSDNLVRAWPGAGARAGRAKNSWL